MATLISLHHIQIMHKPTKKKMHKFGKFSRYGTRRKNEAN